MLLKVLDMPPTFPHNIWSFISIFIFILKIKTAAWQQDVENKKSLKIMADKDSQNM